MARAYPSSNAPRLSVLLHKAPTIAKLLVEDECKASHVGIAKFVSLQAVVNDTLSFVGTVDHISFKTQ